MTKSEINWSKMAFLMVGVGRNDRKSWSIYETVPS